MNVVDDAVAEQYRDYPYPPRNPEDDRTQLKTTWLGHVAHVNGVFWGGRRRALRVLDAGCGTGDATIYLAHQGVDVVALDASESSLAITRRRAAVRGFTNVRFVHASLLDLPRLGLGRFDYVLCSGVLHHLTDPAAGLRALVDVLDDDGGLGLMLYARYGREPVYQVQDLLRRLAGADPLAARVEVATEVLAALPAWHFFQLARRERGFLDVDAGPSGIVDLLLHARDRAYTVPEIHALLDGAGLGLVAFEPPILYRPESYALSPGLRERVGGLPEPERQAVAELLNGRITTHRFYASRAGVPRRVPGPRPAPETVCPVIYQPGLAEHLAVVTQGPFNLKSPWGFAVDMTLDAGDVAMLRGAHGTRLDTILARGAEALARAGQPRTPEAMLARWYTMHDALAGCRYIGYHWADAVDPRVS